MGMDYEDRENWDVPRDCPDTCPRLIAELRKRSPSDTVMCFACDREQDRIGDFIKYHIGDEVQHIINTRCKINQKQAKKIPAIMFERDQIFPLSIYVYAEYTRAKNPGPLFNNTSLYYEETSDSFSTFNDDDCNMLSSYVGILLHLYGILVDGDDYYSLQNSEEVYV